MISLWADNQVDHLRTTLGFRTFRLRNTARERHEGLGAVFTAQTADFGISLLDRLFTDVAGVENDKVGILAVARSVHALGAQQLGHALAVIDVHLAAEG